MVASSKVCQTKFESSLTLLMLGKNSADEILKYFLLSLLFFLRKKALTFHSNFLLRRKQAFTFHANCVLIFWEK